MALASALLSMVLGKGSTLLSLLGTSAPDGWMFGGWLGIGGLFLLGQEASVCGPEEVKRAGGSCRLEGNSRDQAGRHMLKRL